LEAEKEELNLLKTQFSPPLTSWDNQLLERFIQLLAKYQNDIDLILDIIMQVDAKVFNLLYDRNPSFTKRILRQFIEFVISQIWGFDYTDKIGNKCEDLFNSIRDYEIRAELIYCTLEIGVSHNRWHVMGICGELIHQLKRGEELYLIEKLKNTNESTLEIISGYIEIEKLSPKLKEYFDFEDRDGNSNEEDEWYPF
jgi:hypothetical protein